MATDLAHVPLVVIFSKKIYTAKIKIRKQNGKVLQPICNKQNELS